MKAGVKVISDVIDSGYRITHSPPRVSVLDFVGRFQSVNWRGAQWKSARNNYKKKERKLKDNRDVNSLIIINMISIHSNCGSLFKQMELGQDIL